MTSPALSSRLRPSEPPRERMESPERTSRELARALRSIDHSHRLLHTFRLIRRSVATMIGRRPRPLRVLDVGAGSGYLGDQLRRAFGPGVHYLRLDPDAAVFRCVPPRDREWPIQGRSPNFPLKPGSVDVVTSSLVLHHLPREEQRKLLKRSLRLSSGIVIHQDLVRSVPAYLATWVFSRLTSRSPVFRHDAPVSVRRSYTIPEWKRFLRDPSLRPYRLHRTWPWRIHLTAAVEGCRRNPFP